MKREMTAVWSSTSVSMDHYASAVVISCTGGMYLISVMSPKDMQRPRASDANQTQPDWT